MSIMRGVGIASQASDQFDRLRRADRLGDMQEESARRTLDSEMLDREILKIATQHMLAREASRKAPAKAAPGIAPIAAIPSLSGTEQAAKEFTMAKGGEVPAPSKFSGIYDDTAVTERVPTLYSEMMQDWSTPDYKFGGHFPEAVEHVVKTTLQMAQGGEVPGDPYNGVQMYAEGGEVAEPAQGLWSYVRSKLARETPGMKKGGAVNFQKAKPKGGKVKGPGTGTSDSVKGTIDGNRPVALSTGEYVLPKKMVDAIGVDKLDRERMKYI